MHSEVTKLDRVNGSQKLMKVQSVQDEHTDLKVMTDQGYKFVDINIHVKSYVTKK